MSRFMACADHLERYRSASRFPSALSPKSKGTNHPPSPEKHYRRWSLDFLRKWHDSIEAWILEGRDSDSGQRSVICEEAVPLRFSSSACGAIKFTRRDNRHRESTYEAGDMTEDQTPQERIAAARQLYAVLKEYLDRPTWSPMDGTLIVSGIHPAPGCAEVPSGGVGLDGRVFSNGGNERFSDARQVWRKWLWRCEDDQENGDATPNELRPDEFLNWCDDMNIETEWCRLFRTFISGKNGNQVDAIPPAIVEYAKRHARGVDLLLTRLGADESAAAAMEIGDSSSNDAANPAQENTEEQADSSGKTRPAGKASSPRDDMSRFIQDLRATLPQKKRDDVAYVFSELRRIASDESVQKDKKFPLLGFIPNKGVAWEKGRLRVPMCLDEAALKKRMFPETRGERSKKVPSSG